MKKFLLLLFCSGCATAPFAQTSDVEAEAMVSLVNIHTKEAIAKLVQVTGRDSISFWKLYDEYQEKNLAVAKARLRLYEKTTLLYGKMGPCAADSLAHKYFDNRIAQEKILQDYYEKIKGATNAVTAFEFYQAESYILARGRVSVTQVVPTYIQFKAALREQ